MTTNQDNEIQDDGTMTDPPLLGVRVVEWVSGPMRMAARLLADLGATVIHIEPKGRDMTGERIVSGISLDAAALNRGKQVLSVDLDSPKDRQAIRDHLADAHVVMEDCSLRDVSRSLIDIDRLRRDFPALVLVSISNFGRTQGFTQWQATDPVFHALSGILSRSGLPHYPPLLPPSTLAAPSSSSQAAFVALLAFIKRLDTGCGDWLDFSVLDGVVQTFDPGFGVAGSAAAGVQASDMPRGRPRASHRYPIIPCKNGHVRICILSARQWRGLFEWMGSPKRFADPSFERLPVRYKSEHLIPAIAAFFADKTREDLERSGQKFGVPISMVLSLEDAIETPQNRARRLFESVSLKPGIDIRLPRAAVHIDGKRAVAALPSRIVTHEWPASRDRASENTPRLPLTGIRVLDLGVIVVGAETGRLLADAGADVVKVENADFPDGIRQTGDGSLMSASFAAGQRNKHGLAIDLRAARGKELFLDLVKSSDVLLANFKPGTLDSLGLTLETLRSANPHLVVIDSSAFGTTGPASRQLGYGPLVRAATGLSSAWRYPGQDESFSDALTVYPDHCAARIGALAALALMIRRRRTKRGGVATIAQAEIIHDHMAVDIAVAELASAGQEVDGAECDAPWGVFACSGDDAWCVVTVRNDHDWRKLAPLLDLADDATLNSRTQRAAARQRIDGALSDWLADYTAEDAAALLQTAGIPAGAMLRVGDMPGFAYFRARGFFRKSTHPLLVAPFVNEARAVRSTGIADPADDPAPLLGEHSVATLEDWLGLSPAQTESLLLTGIIADRAGAEEAGSPAKPPIASRVEKNA